MIPHSEYETTATLNGREIPVTASYDRDGYEVQVFSVRETADPENELLDVLSDADSARIEAACYQDNVDNLAGMAEAYAEGER